MKKNRYTLHYRILMVLSAFISSCTLTDSIEIPPTELDSELIFHTSFEGSSQVVPTSNDQIDDIVGIDPTVSAPNDWKKDFDDHPNIGEFRLYYEGGDQTGRSAKVMPEPGNTRNNVLMFRVDKPNAGTKGRVQADIYKNKGLKEIYQKVRVFFHPDFNELKNYPARIWWLTLFEAWNNGGWIDQEHAFRVSINFEKRKTSGSRPEEFYFHVHGQQYDESNDYVDYYAQTNWNVPIPIGQWLTLETYFLEGDAKTGRFYFAMQPDGGKKEVIFDIHDFTHHPKDPNPDGLTEFNPIKLYAPDEVINYMQDKKKVLQVYWDDYELWQNRRPDFIILH